MSDLARAIQKPGSETRLFRYGVVAAYTASASTITVTLDGAAVVLPCLVGPSYAVGKTVAIARDGRSGGLVLGVLGTAAVVVTPDPPPAPKPVEPTVTRRTKTLLPTFTGSYRGGWRDIDDVYQGDYGGWGNNTGAAFYGNQFTALKADTSQPYSAVVTYRRRLGGIYAAQVPTFRLLTQKSKPAGLPTLNESASGTAVAVNTVATWTLPSAWVLALLNGSRGGLGIYEADSDPYIGLNGLSTYGSALSIKITYYA